jgi:hypothetical protein
VIGLAMIIAAVIAAGVWFGLGGAAAALGIVLGVGLVYGAWIELHLWWCRRQIWVRGGKPLPIARKRKPPPVRRRVRWRW